MLLSALCMPWFLQRSMQRDGGWQLSLVQLWFVTLVYPPSVCHGYLRMYGEKEDEGQLSLIGF